MRTRSFFCLYALSALSIACNASMGDGPDKLVGGGATAGAGAQGGAGGAGGGAGSGGVILPEPDGGGNPDADVIVRTLPPGFTQTEIGGFHLGPSLVGGAAEAGAGTGNESCGNVLLGVVRDFRGRSEPNGHPDFEGPLYGNDITSNLVSSTLGSDQKPIYASLCEEGRASPAPTCPFGPETTTQANFDQWYRYTPNVNEPFIVYMWFAPQPNGVYTFQSLFFYPLDNAGFGNSGTGKEGGQHNFSFTTELHTRFQYSGGETFLFEGDDDVWVFINNQLVVDVGGLHPKKSGSIDLDANASRLGLVQGTVYTLDLFHAERHTPESTFRIDTNLSFVDCGSVPPDIPK